MGDPLAAGALALLPLRAGHGLAHGSLHARRRAHRDLCLHAALPQGEAAVRVGGVDGAPDAVLVGAHVRVRHADGVDVGVREPRIPVAGVRHAVDVVPASGVEAHEVPAQRRPDLHQLERRLQLLHQDIGLDRRGRQAQVPLQRVEHLAPQGGLLGGLDLGQVQDDGPALGPQRRVVEHHVRDEVRDRGGEPGPVRPTHMAVVEVQAADAEQAGGEVELATPVVDDLAAQEVARPGVHLARDALGDPQEARVHRQGQPQVALAVERHALGLAQRILAIEHPAVRAGEERVGHVAQALLHRRAGPRGGPRALDPLAPQVSGDLAPLEPARARVGHAELRPPDQRAWVKEADRLVVARPSPPAGDPARHDRAALEIERRQGVERVEDGGRVDVGVGVAHAGAELEFAGHDGSRSPWRPGRVPAVSRARCRGCDGPTVSRARGRGRSRWGRCTRAS